MASEEPGAVQGSKADQIAKDQVWDILSPENDPWKYNDENKQQTNSDVMAELSRALAAATAREQAAVNAYMASRQRELS